jgi:DNA-binding SARP family transcriptional activator
VDVRIQMFGGFSIAAGGAEIGSADSSSPLLWDLMAYLINFRAREVPQSELMEALWGESELRNPQSALKVLVHRARGVLDSLSLDSKALLVGQRGSYRWDSSVVSQQLDTETFEQLLAQADACRDESKACRLRLQAIALYDGDFLSNLAAENWVMPLSAFYSSKYLRAVYAAAASLQNAGQYEQSLELCKSALKLAPYDEPINTYFIEALVSLGRSQLALSHYNKVVRTLREQFDVEPSQEFSDLYREIMGQVEDQESSVNDVAEKIRSGDTERGAFFCEPAVFEEICRYDARTKVRSGGVAYLAVLTLRANDGGALPKNSAERAARLLQGTIRDSLRSGDCFAKLNAVQQEILLQNTTYEKGVMVVERVIRAYQRRNPGGKTQIGFSLGLLEPKQFA